MQVRTILHKAHSTGQDHLHTRPVILTADLPSRCVVLILQIRKLRLRESEALSPHHTASDRVRVPSQARLTLCFFLLSRTQTLAGDPLVRYSRWAAKGGYSSLILLPAPE